MQLDGNYVVSKFAYQKTLRYKSTTVASIAYIGLLKDKSKFSICIASF